jgi:RecA-family ATPase
MRMSDYIDEPPAWFPDDDEEKQKPADEPVDWDAYWSEPIEDRPDVEAAEFESKIEHWTIGRDEYAPSEYLVDGLIEAGGIGLWFGGAGIGKTLLLQAMAATMTIGGTFLENDDDLPQFQCRPARVLWIDFDNGRRTTRIRSAAALKGVRAPNDAPFFQMSETLPWLALDDESHITALAEAIVHLEIDITFIDALGLVTGDIDENSPDMSAVMRNIKKLRDLTKSAVHLIHHPNKVSRDQSPHLFNAAGNAKITNFCEFAVEMRKGGEADQIVCTVVKKRNYVSADKFAAAKSIVHMPDSWDLDSFTFEADKIKSIDDLKAETFRDAVRELLADGAEMTKTKLVKTAKKEADKTLAHYRAVISQPDATDELDLMEDEGIVEFVPGPKNSTIVLLEVL